MWKLNVRSLPPGKPPSGHVPHPSHASLTLTNRLFEIYERIRPQPLTSSGTTWQGRGNPRQSQPLHVPARVLQGRGSLGRGAAVAGEHRHTDEQNTHLSLGATPCLSVIVCSLYEARRVAGGEREHRGSCGPNNGGCQHVNLASSCRISTRTPSLARTFNACISL